MNDGKMRDDRSVPNATSVGASPTGVHARGRVSPAHPVWAVAGAILLAVVASGCGGQSANPANAANGQTVPSTSVGSVQAASACKLLGEGDVTAAMQQPMKVSGDGGTICSYSATADPSVVLDVQTFATRADAATDTQLEVSSEHISGLGDDAFWNPTLDMVFVQHGDQAFSVTLPSLANLSGDPQVTKMAMVGLAKIVLQNS